MKPDRTFTAFAGNRLIASGDVKSMLLKTKERLDGGETATILIFEDQTGKQVDFDFRGAPQDVLDRLASHPLFAPVETREKPPAGPGRPKLGVVGREVSLLPRHWEWLERQPGGVSGALRRLVDEARKLGEGKERVRLARDAAGKFMWAMAGNLPNFEEATRALFAGDLWKLDEMMGDWPKDIRKHVDKLVKEWARLEKEAAAGGPAAV